MGCGVLVLQELVEAIHDITSIAEVGDLSLLETSQMAKHEPKTVATVCYGFSVTKQGDTTSNL